MDTNTIMLIALAIIIVLSALGIWLANRGSGVEDPHRALDPVESDDPSKTHTSGNTASTPKVVDRKTTSDVKPATEKPNVRVVDNTKKTPTTKGPADFKNKNSVNEARDLKNPPKTP